MYFICHLKSILMVIIELVYLKYRKDLHVTDMTSRDGDDGYDFSMWKWMEKRTYFQSRHLKAFRIKFSDLHLIETY